MWARWPEGKVVEGAWQRFGNHKQVAAAIKRHRGGKGRQAARDQAKAAKQKSTEAAEARRERALEHEAEVGRRKAEREAAYQANLDRYDIHAALPTALSDGGWLGRLEPVNDPSRRPAGLHRGRKHAPAGRPPCVAYRAALAVPHAWLRG